MSLMKDFVSEEGSELCRMPVGHTCWGRCNQETDEHYTERLAVITEPTFQLGEAPLYTQAQFDVAFTAGQQAERKRIRELIKGMLKPNPTTEFAETCYNVALGNVILAIDGGEEPCPT